MKGKEKREMKGKMKKRKGRKEGRKIKTLKSGIYWIFFFFFFFFLDPRDWYVCMYVCMWEVEEGKGERKERIGKERKGKGKEEYL